MASTKAGASAVKWSWRVFGFIILTLVLRFLLALIGVSASIPIVAIIYRVTEAFRYVFRFVYWLLGVTDVSFGKGTFEWTALVAIAMYLVVGFLVSKLLARL